MVQSIQIAALSVASGPLLIEDGTNEINDELDATFIIERNPVMSACEFVCVYQSASS